jgi:putative transcriptional regulator
MAKPLPIANNIRRLRFEHGEMTQEELARRIGMTRQTVAAIEKAKYSPSLEAAFRIARAFGVGLDDVFQWAEDNGQSPKG